MPPKRAVPPYIASQTAYGQQPARLFSAPAQNARNQFPSRNSKPTPGKLLMNAKASIGPTSNSARVMQSKVARGRVVAPVQVDAMAVGAGKLTVFGQGKSAVSPTRPSSTGATKRTGRRTRS